MKAESVPASAISISKQKGVNANCFAESVTREAGRLKHGVLRDTVEMKVTRYSGVVANIRLSELTETLSVAVVVVVLLVTFG